MVIWTNSFNPWLDWLTNVPKRNPEMPKTHSFARYRVLQIIPFWIKSIEIAGKNQLDSTSFAFFVRLFYSAILDFRHFVRTRSRSTYRLHIIIDANDILPLTVAVSFAEWLHWISFFLRFKDKMEVDAANVLTHAINSVLMFLDILIVSHPMRLYHVVQPMAFGLLYGVFSLIYYFCGGLDP